MRGEFLAGLSDVADPDPSVMLLAADLRFGELFNRVMCGGPVFELLRNGRTNHRSSDFRGDPPVLRFAGRAPT
jgi:hypothetical protein